MSTTNTQTEADDGPRFKLLLVEDDLRLATTIQEYLQQNEFEVDVESRGDTAIGEILKCHHDLVILDIMLPGVDGLEVCRQVRQDFHGPILMLTARDDSVEQVVGLEIGADDYVTKPVSPRLLLARIRALIRHAKRTSGSISEQQNQLSFGQLSINQMTRTVTWQNSDITCTEVEFELLWLLASNAGKILSRDYIYETLIGYAYNGLDRAVDIRISRLRKIFEISTASPTRIKTVRGKGYLFVESAWH